MSQNLRLATWVPIVDPAAIGNAIRTASASSANKRIMSEFAAAASGGGGSSVSISDAPPPTPSHGDLWWESDGGGLYIYFNDGNSSQWIGVSGPAGVEGPPGPQGAPGSGGSAAWGDITGKPATFPPTVPIAQADVTNLTTDLGSKAPLASPALTGTPTAPLPAVAADSTQIATTEWVKDQYLQASVVYDPPSLATNTNGTIQLITVTGAALGDFVLASHPADMTGVSLVAWVSGTNSVKFQYQNRTAGTVDIPSGTVRIRVWKQ